MRTTLTLLTFILLLEVCPCVAQPPAKYSATVDLVISGRASDGDSLTNQFNSFLSRELRSLGDIRIEHEKPDYVISVVVMKLTTGFTAAVLITKPQKADILTDPTFMKTKIEGYQLQLLQVWITNTVAIMKLGLRSGTMYDVQEACREIIADFDTETLNPDRTSWDTLHRPVDKPK